MSTKLHVVPTPETRRFQVNANIIFDLIKRQAGTLAKGVAENVSNSHDAGAKNVWIAITNKGITIKDDGPGFVSREEIVRVFEVLGFVHDDKQRDFGRFGIGRAQLWSFADAKWVSNGFRMDVNIEKRGLDYDFYEGLPPVAGLTITGNFYQKLLTSELTTFEKELAALVRYAPLNVHLNDRKLSKDPATEKWDHDTPDAWIRLKEAGELTVYNMGIMVRSYEGYQHGSGGVVVTKPGVNLALNMARNDILITQCVIWKRIRKFVQGRSDERVRTKKTRVSESELENLTQRYLADELSYPEIESIKIITDIQGRGWTLQTFLYALDYPPRSVTTAPAGSRLGEQAHRAKLGFVVGPQTLSRFGVETVVEMKEVLVARMAQEPGHPRNSIAHLLLGRLQQTLFTDDLKIIAGALADGYIILPQSQWTAEEKAALASLRGAVFAVGVMMGNHGMVSQGNQYRRLSVGTSDTALAWTNGRNSIVLERDFVTQAQRGVTGFMAILNVIVHELLHDEADTGSHEHAAEFYQRFHDLTSDPTFDLGKWVMKSFASYVYRMKANKLPLRAAALADVKAFELAEREADSGDADDVDDAEAGGDAIESSASTPALLAACAHS